MLVKGTLRESRAIPPEIFVLMMPAAESIDLELVWLAPWLSLLGCTECYCCWEVVLAITAGVGGSFGVGDLFLPKFMDRVCTLS